MSCGSLPRYSGILPAHLCPRGWRPTGARPGPPPNFHCCRRTDCPSDSSAEGDFLRKVRGKLVGVDTRREQRSIKAPGVTSSSL